MNKIVLITFLVILALAAVLYGAFRLYKQYKESNEIAAILLLKDINIEKSPQPQSQPQPQPLTDFEKYIRNLYEKDKFESISKLDNQISKLNAIFVNFDKKKYKPITQDDKKQINRPFKKKK